MSEQNENEQEVVKSKISRRGFLKAGGAVMGTVVLGGVVAGCGDNVTKIVKTAGTNGSDTPTPPVSVTETMTADVVVIGLGASGLMAAISAANAGANVIAIDSAAAFEGTTNTHTTGAWLIESKEQLKYAHYLTQEEAFKRIIPGTNYQSNGKVLRNIIRSSAQAANYLIDGGVKFFYAFAGSDESSPMLNRGGHVYLEEGTPRADNFRNMCAQYKNLKTLFDCKASQILKDGGGKVNGIICNNNGTGTQINARAVICCTGGFLSNADMMKELFAGAVIVNQGFYQNDGSGIKMCRAAGAQIGKNFSISCNEMGAANFKASLKYSWAPGRNTSPCFYLPLFGNILVDKRGYRFMNEQQMAENTMYCGEPLLRDSYYYTVIDSAYLETIKSTPVFDFLSAGTKANMGGALLAGFKDVTLSDFAAAVETAISEGWAAKADSFESLAAAFKTPNLTNTLNAFNAACAKGVDDEFYLPADYLRPIKKGPFYIFEYNPGAWVTLGGIKTDGFCRAVDKNNTIVKGLYVGGVDGDFWSVPYFQGGSCNGFALASGVLAGKTAAAEV